MGIIASIVLGPTSGLLANMLIPGKRSQGSTISSTANVRCFEKLTGENTRACAGGSSRIR